MFNPVLIEIAANERVADLRRARGRSSVVPVSGGAAARAGIRERRRGRRARVANPQATIGWLLVSIGLRLVVPRTPARPAR
jgi:hypothetical protein